MNIISETKSKIKVCLILSEDKDIDIYVSKNKKIQDPSPFKKKNSWGILKLIIILPKLLCIFLQLTNLY